MILIEIRIIHFVGFAPEMSILPRFDEDKKTQDVSGSANNVLVRFADDLPFQRRIFDPAPQMWSMDLYAGVCD